MPWAPHLITVVLCPRAARNTRPRRKGCDRCRYCYQTRRLSRRSLDPKPRFCKHLLISASMAARPAAVRPWDYSWSRCAMSAGFRTLPRSSSGARRRRSLIPAGYGMRARVLITYWFKQTFYPFYKIGQSIGQEVAKVIGSAKEKRTFRAAAPAQDAAVGVVLPTPAPAAQIGVAITH